MKPLLPLTVVLVALILLPITVFAEITGPVSLSSGRKGWGSTAGTSEGTTWTDASYQYQYVYDKGFGVDGGAPYCTDYEYAETWWGSYAAVPAPFASYSGYWARKHYWNWGGSDNVRYTSHDAAHSSYSWWSIISIIRGNHLIHRLFQ